MIERSRGDYQRQKRLGGDVRRRQEGPSAVQVEITRGINKVCLSICAHRKKRRGDGIDVGKGVIKEKKEHSEVLLAGGGKGDLDFCTQA